MKIEIKHLLSFIPLVLACGVLYGSFTTKIEALETKVGTMESISTDVAIIKEKIMWMEEFMIKTYEGDF
ncbi:hypothetical protein N9Z96_00905 [bacterium]|nr:hypothetical protein [bacterium]|tara:strand:+ start:122 stop:328 length:207 start_codon:yes stop_codon:yes gene_type:complete